MIACPACGRINDPARRFCGGCGAALTTSVECVPAVRQGPPTAPQITPAAVPPSRSLGATLKLGFLIVLVTAGLAALGSLLGPGGAAVFLGLAVVLNFASYWFSDRLVILATGAKEVSRD